MKASLVAQQMAEQAFVTRPRTAVALGVFGQSNERGNVPLSDMAAYPQAFRSLRNPGGPSVPIGPAVSLGSGGWWCKVYDDLWDWGYDLRIVNGAVGSLSFLRDAAGQIQTRSNSLSYFVRRPAGGHPDRGFFGDLICPNATRVFQCTAGGRVRAAFGDAPFKVSGQQTNLDYIETAGTQQSAATAPSFSGKTLGDVVIDGDLTWTCIALDPTAWGGDTSGTTGPGLVLTEAQKGLGFDPLGAMVRLHEEMQRVRDVSRRIIYIQNGQADLGASTVKYSAALQSIANYFLSRGYEVMIGLSTFNPANGNLTYHNQLSAGVNDAIATLKAGNNANRVFAGANLYTAMGSAGPMALGGAFIQSIDNVHLNGAGAVGPDVAGISCAGRYASDAVKAVLPRLR